MSTGMALIAGIVIGGIGVLLVQAMFENLMEWWADVVETGGYWVIRALVTCGILFLICVFAFAKGWRP